MNKTHKISVFLLFLAILFGLLVLVGWKWDIQVLKSVFPSLISMKANTAVGLISLAIASYLLSLKETRIGKILGIMFAVFVLLLATLTLSEYLSGKNLKIDELLFLDSSSDKRWPPGRFAPITGINFIFIGTALLLHTINSSRFVKLTQGLVMIAWIASAQALIAYICGNTYSFGSAFYTQIALHTSVLFILITTANLLVWRNEGYLKHLSGDDVAGKVGRKLLLASVLIPPLINVVQIHGFKMNLYDEDFGVLIRVVGSIVFFAWMAMLTGRYLYEIDGQKTVALEAQRIRTEELQRALQARDDLLSICSHELRTPISSMKLQTQFIKHQMAKNDKNNFSSEKMAAIIEQSDRQLDRLTKLIEDMLDFSRINSGRFSLSKEEFDLHELIVTVIDNFKIQLKANQCEMILSVHSESPLMVYWDNHRIEQLVSNLLTNALKYGSRRPIEISLSQDLTTTSIQVRDQGMGIAPTDYKRIFEPYERAVSVSKISGLGLGLFISKKIAEAHGGCIEVQSLAGIGSTFTALIPTRTSDHFDGSLNYAS